MELIAILLLLFISWICVYKATKVGLIDDAINFIKSKI